MFANFLRNKSAFRSVLQEGKLDFAILRTAASCPSFFPIFVQMVALSISYQGHCLIFHGFVKAGGTVGIRIASLKVQLHLGLPDMTSVYLVRPCTWTWAQGCFRDF